MKIPGAEIHHPRDLVLRVLLLGAVLALAFRAFQLQVVETPFLQDKAANRHVRIQTQHAHRGMVLDRHGEPLAISTPVQSLWVDPAEFVTVRYRWPELERLLGLPGGELDQLVGQRLERRFVYLRRGVAPDLADRARALGLPGLHSQREYRRYYPTGEVSGHLLGFTNIDDQGQEGLELVFDDSLAGTAGKVRVLQDLYQRWVQPVEELQRTRAGTDLQLTLDRRLQYLAYRELKAAVHRHRAESGSAVVVEIPSGHILAMVNQPAFNPNETADRKPARYRNRAVTDLFEPGSTIKPFVVAAALTAGLYRADSVIDTDPGFVEVSGHKFRDHRSFGPLTLAGILQKSSNVGAIRLSMGLDPAKLEQLLLEVGFSSPTGSGLPGESSGVLPPAYSWRKVDQAALSFGYGLSVTPLQLARAYAILGNHGRELIPRIVAAHPTPPRQLLSQRVADQVLAMLETVVAPEGTGHRAAVEGYRVAGKTGTAHMFAQGGYDRERYISTFAGLAPASAPRMAMVVTIKDPQGEAFYAGDVAAPVFSRFMNRALPLLGVAPDREQQPVRIVSQPGATV